MFERFTERARQVIVLAQDEAKLNKNDTIGREHLLVGLLREEEGLGARVLERFDVTVERLRADLPPKGDKVFGATTQIPFEADAKKVLELALREALSLGHNYIGTEHLLLAMVRCGAAIPGASAEQIRDAVIDLLVGRGAAREPLSEEALRAREDRVRAGDEARLGGYPLEEDRRPLEAELSVLNALQIELATRGFYASVTTFRVNEQYRGVAPAGDRKLLTMSGWHARLNVDYDTYDRTAMDVLAGLAADHGCRLEFSRKHGPTFRPEPGEAVAVVKVG